MNKIMIPALIVCAIALAVYLIVKQVKHGGGCCGEHEAMVNRVTVKDKHKSHYPYSVQMKIEGMTCENCSRRVENALNALDGVWAKVDIGSHAAKVRLKNPPDEEQLMRAVMTAGYIVSEITEETQPGKRSVK